MNWLLTGVFSLSIGSVLAFGFPQSRRPRLAVEFRLAETAIAKGLTKAVVVNSDQTVYLHKEAIITNKDIVEANAVQVLWQLGDPNPDTSPGSFKVNVVFTKEAAARMSRVTARNQGKMVAIVLDGNVISAPVISGTIHDRAAISSAGMTKEEAERIAASLQSRQ